jgi:hypothetical protein
MASAHALRRETSPMSDRFVEIAAMLGYDDFVRAADGEVLAPNPCEASRDGDAASTRPGPPRSERK